MRTLNIIGCGKVGKTLGRLFLEQGQLEIGDVVNRSRESAEAAVSFLGSGEAGSLEKQLRPAEIYLLSTPDDALDSAVKVLVESNALRPGDIAFHTSGARSSEILAMLRSLGVHIASVHPVKSFADPATATNTFQGTFCAVEGDKTATEVLTELFEGIGGSCFRIDSENKMLYHAASVMVCNYLTALFELGMELFEQTGIKRMTGMRLVEPLVRETVDNVFRLGTTEALTGPIARGDSSLVAAQLAEVSKHNERAGAIYRLLGQVALELSQAKGDVTAEALEELARVLGEQS